MAIATGTAILGAAAIGAGASVIGGSKQSKAIQRGTDANLALGRESNALAREIYGQNSANMQQYMASGRRANALLDSFIYGDAPQVPTQPQAAPQQYGPPIMAPNAPSGAPGGVNALRGGGMIGRQLQDVMLSRGMMPSNGGAFAAQVYGGPQQPIPQGQVTTAAVPQQSGRSAFDTFRNSTNYQWKFDEAMRGLNHGLASNGLLQSGAAVKAAQDRAGNLASNELGNFLGLVQGQQGLGFGAASALAGVGQNYAGLVSANNNAMGNAAMQGAQGRANALGNIWGGIAGAAGMAGGALSSSYRPSGAIPYGFGG